MKTGVSLSPLVWYFPDTNHPQPKAHGQRASGNHNEGKVAAEGMPAIPQAWNHHLS
jgi:hypothetical protein